MLVTEYPYSGKENRIRHYSDENKMIKQNETGNLYGEAIDNYPCQFTYSESIEPIPDEVDDGTALAELTEVINNDEE